MGSTADRSFGTRDTEIGIGIDENGEFVHVVRGYHRLAMAKILELEQVPAQVVVRHSNWESIRQQFKANDLQELPDRISKYKGHPDIVDLIN